MPALFSSPKMPTPQTPAVMPTPDDAQIQAAKRQKEAALMATTGRQSTILNQNDDKFGG